MPIFDSILDSLPYFIPVLFVLALVTTGLWISHWFFFKREGGFKEEARFSARMGMLLLVGLSMVVVLLTLPVEKETHRDLFGLLGLLLTAVITLSSTTFVSNAMAGIMLRGMQSFRLGDFLRVEQQFGRITERGLFHTEIQTEDRDLTTLPNLYLVSHPFTVVRASGTIVSSSVSLGYDSPPSLIQNLLLQAARNANLTEPFVHVMALGDFSVTYRVSGFLSEVNHLLSSRSMLKTQMLATLHEAGIEIVSPAFMNQRRLEDGLRIIPPSAPSSFPKNPTEEIQAHPEARIFDKADAVAQVEELREQRHALQEEIKSLQAHRKQAGESVKPWLDRRIQRIQEEAEKLDSLLKNAKDHQPD